MTETGPLSVDSELAEVTSPKCVGRPVDGVEIRILDQDDRILRIGQEGRVAVRVEGQWFPPDVQRVDGFWPNGDIGRLDADGRLFLVGRATPFTDERADYS
jgi:fatty-acyl-CoA synthase